MSQASYLNGYDDGYEDAVKELAKSGGSGSGGGSAPAARRPDIFTVAQSVSTDDGYSSVNPLADGDKIDPAPDDPSTVSAHFIDAHTFHVDPPDGGWVPGDMFVVYVDADYLNFEVNGKTTGDTSTSNIGVYITSNGSPLLVI